MIGYFEAGKDGPRVVLRNSPSAEELRELVRRQVVEVICNRSLGWVGRDLSFLRQIPGLKSFLLFDLGQIDLDPIKEVPSLTKLSLQIDPEQSFDLTALSGLEDCGLWWFAGAETVFSLRRISRLSLDGLPVRYADGIGRLPRLRELKILGSKLRAIRDCGKLSSLTHLRLAACPNLTSLEGLSHSAELQGLVIQQSPIGTVREIASLVELTSLALDDCGNIDTIQPLAAMRHLEKLVLSGSTRIVDGDLSVLGHLPALKSLAAKNHKHYRPSVRSVQSALVRGRDISN